MTSETTKDWEPDPTWVRSVVMGFQTCQQPRLFLVDSSGPNELTVSVCSRFGKAPQHVLGYFRDDLLRYAVTRYPGLVAAIEFGPIPGAPAGTVGAIVERPNAAPAVLNVYRFGDASVELALTRPIDPFLFLADYEDPQRVPNWTQLTSRTTDRTSPR